MTCGLQGHHPIAKGDALWPTRHGADAKELRLGRGQDGFTVQQFRYLMGQVRFNQIGSGLQ